MAAKQYMLNPAPLSLKVEKSTKEFYERLATIQGVSVNELVSSVLTATKTEVENMEKEVLTPDVIKSVAKDIVTRRFFEKVYATVSSKIK
jgi:hypothetical protein